MRADGASGVPPKPLSTATALAVLLPMSVWYLRLPQIPLHMRFDAVRVEQQLLVMLEQLLEKDYKYL